MTSEREQCAAVRTSRGWTPVPVTGAFRTWPGGKGFTLIELLVVMALIGILMGLLLPAIGQVKARARARQIQLECRGLETAIRAFHQEYGWWPALDPNANAAVTARGWTNNNAEVTAYLIPPGNARNIDFLGNGSSGPALNPTGAYYRIVIDVVNNSVTVSSP